MPHAKNKFQWEHPMQRRPSSMLRFPQHTECFFDYQHNKLYPGIIHIRPYLKPFLRYCFQQCNVAFWSTGNADYVRNIVLHLLYIVDKQPHDIIFAWGRTSRSGHGHKDSTHFIDCLTGELISQEGLTHHLRSEQNHKHLDYVFSKFPKLIKDTVLLVDNLPSHSTLNKPENVLYLPPYTYMNAHDTILQSLQSKTKTSKKEFVFNANHIRETLSILSPTNDNVYYPNGYIDESTFRNYHANPISLQPNQKVIVPIHGVYVVASVVNVHTPKRASPEKPIMVVVKVLQHDSKPVLLNEHSAKASTPNKGRYRTVHVPLSDVVTDVDEYRNLYVY